MHKNLIALGLLAGLASLAQTANADDDRRRVGTAPTAPATTTPTTPPATTPVTPPAGAQTLGAAGEGRRLYLKLNCYSCHGMTPTGGMGPNIVHADQGDVSEAVRQGEGGGMRSYSSYVTATDLTNLGAYLRSIGTASEPKFKDWWVAVPTK